MGFPTQLLSWSSIGGVPGSSCLIRLHLFLSVWGRVFSETVSSPEIHIRDGGGGAAAELGTESCFRAYAANFSAPPARTTQTLTIERRGVEIEEGGIKVKLTLVDTPGFGDSVDCSDW